jgi:hypothetical protein
MTFVPNHSRRPLIIYRGALRSAGIPDEEHESRNECQHSMAAYRLFKQR